jgi:hypothetical protein
MNQLFLHRGGELLNRDQLDLIPVPKTTDSYIPVPHYQLAERLVTISTDILRDYVMVGEHYAVARQGNQMFAVLKFQKEELDIGLSIAFRNSYDRSMSLGLAIGATVFVCDNLALQGDIVVMRKHTKNVWNELEDLTITTLYKSEKQFQQIVADSELLKRQNLPDDEAFMFMGKLFGYGIVSLRQLTVLKQEWFRPSHVEFRDRNMWSFFNATTETLKSCPPFMIMEKHAQAYNLLVHGTASARRNNGVS